MKIELNNEGRRSGKVGVEAHKVKITVGEAEYRITETIDGYLCINKIANVGRSSISITPCVSNEIQIK